MSSKFSSRPPARKRPAVCKQQPPKTTPIPGTDLRRQVTAWVNFVDQDPLQPGKQVATFQLDWDETAQHYFGRSGTEPERLELTFVRTVDPVRWNCQLDVWDTWRLPETFFYPNIEANPRSIFDTPKFGDVVISGLDFRQIQILE